VDLKVPIVIHDELAERVIDSTGLLDLASGEIRNVQYEDYDAKVLGLPAEDEEYEFTCGTLSNEGKDVEFRVEVDIFSGRYSVSPNELLEIKIRAAKLFAGIEGADLLANATAAPAKKKAAAGGKPEAKPKTAPKKRFH
jgi:glycerophosphoryl diester phosphodiesterase